MSRLIASIARMRISVSRPTQYDDNTSGPTRRTAPRTPAIANRPAFAPEALRRGRLSSATIQPGRFEREDYHHRRKQRAVRQLRDERLAEVVDHADDDAADEGALETPHAADDHHDKRERQEV